MLLFERQADPIVDFVTATAAGRADRGNQTGPLHGRPHRPYAHLDHPLCQTPPAGMDRGDRTAVLCGDQNRNTIRSHDADAETRCGADEDVRLWPNSQGSTRGLEQIDAMNLD